MKKKVLYGLFMAACAFAAVGTLQSCKDDVSDLEQEIALDRYNVDGVISTLRSDIEAAKAECATKIAELQAQISANDGDIEQLKQNLDALQTQLNDKASIDWVNKQLSQIESDYKAYTDTKVGDLRTELEGKIASEIAGVNAAIGQLSTDMQNKFDNVNGEIAKIKNSINSLEADIAAANAQIEVNKAAIASINSELDKIGKTLKAHEDLITDLQQKYTTLDQKIDAVQSELMNEINELWRQVNGNTELIGQVYNDLTDKIQEVNDRLEAIDAQLAYLTNRINDMLTSIIVQGVDNPIFGNFSLPLGVQSNLVFDWYGKFSNDVAFPSALAENTYDAEACVLTPEDLAFLKNSLGMNSTESIDAGYVTNETLGKIYMTLNPIGHNLTVGKTFSLENTAGKKLPFKLDAKESDDVLSFFYSRNASNGFYSAEVVLPAEEDAINSVDVVIDENLKNAAKDILNDVSKRNALNLLKAIYNQLDGMLPRYALRADWHNKNRESYAVVSGYDLAVATAQPLSYKFLYGKGTDHQLPTFGTTEALLQKLRDKINFNFELNSTIEFDEFTINFTDLVLDFSNINLDIQGGDEIEVQMPTMTVTIDGETYEVKVDGNPKAQLGDVYAAIEDAFKDAIAKLGSELQGDINEQLRTKVIASIQTQVNNMLKDIQTQIDDMLKNLQNEINGQINSTIDDIFGEIEPYFARLDKVINVYNKVAEKVNDFLKNPNHYLQVAAFYTTSSSIGVLSNVKEDPTVFVNGGGDSFDIFLSSYTAETVCPAYKKFAAIVNVYDANGRSVREAEKANLARINGNSSGLNRVLDGRTFRVIVPVSGMKAGYTYELVYQGLDYSGVTSTQKFYIKVQ